MNAEQRAEQRKARIADATRQIAWEYGEAREWDVRGMRLTVCSDRFVWRYQVGHPTPDKIDVDLLVLEHWKAAQLAGRNLSGEQIEQTLIDTFESLTSCGRPLKEIRERVFNAIYHSDATAFGYAMLSAMFDIVAEEAAENPAEEAEADTDKPAE